MSFADPDRRLRPGIEFQEILFDAVAEDDSILRHLRFEDERRLPRDATENQRCAGRLRWKWFAHGEKQIIGVPGEFCIQFDIDLATGFRICVSVRPTFVSSASLFRIAASLSE